MDRMSHTCMESDDLLLLSCCFSAYRPLLALPAGVFSLGYFKMWIIIALTWGFAATLICLVLPWWESRAHVGKIVKGVATGQAFKKRAAAPVTADIGLQAAKGTAY